MTTIPDVEPSTDLLYEAWVLLANGAYWDQTDTANSVLWLKARDRWRDAWHKQLAVLEDA